MAKLLSGTRIYGNLLIDTNVAILGSNISSNTTTGALTVAGGAGIAGNLNVGGNVVITGNLSITGNLTSVNYETVTNTEYVTTLIATTVNAATIGNSGATLTGTLSTAAQTNITSVGTITSGTWSGSFGAVSGANLTNLTAVNLLGTAPTANVSLYDSVNAYTTNQTFYPTFANVTTGNSTQGTSTTLTYNPSTGALSATSFNGVGTFSTATTSGTLIASGNIVAASGTTSTSTTTGSFIAAGGVGVAGDAYIGGNVNITNRSYAKFSPSASEYWIGLRSPSSLTANVIFNLPSADGTVGQFLKTDGAGNFSFAAGGGGSSGFAVSTITTHPLASGDKSLGTGSDNVTEETPFASGGTDAFGISLGIVYDQMEPTGTTVTVELGSGISI